MTLSGMVRAAGLPKLSRTGLRIARSFIDSSIQ